MYELADHLGSSALTVDAARSWINREEYFPYGETSFGSFSRKRYRFTGKQRDDESGLAYHGARYYAAHLLRWISVDPAVVQRQANSYSYVKASPIRYLDPDGKYERDMHQLGVYYILRARGYSPGQADRMAGFSQYVDEDPATEPVRLSGRELSVGINRNAVQTRVFFHFIGSTENTPTVQNDVRARARVAQTFAMLTSRTTRERAAGQILAGAAMHTFLDTFSHEGFTGHLSSQINTRTGGIPGIARAGHADTAEGGHAPDRPYNDVDKALTALHSLYDLIPESRQGKSIPWYEIELELRIALSVRQPDLADRMATMERLIRSRFGDSMNLDMTRFANEGPMYRRYTEDWRRNTERTEAAQPPINIGPLR